MLKKIMEYYKNFEKITRKVLKGGLEFCFGLSSIAIIILLTYNFFFAYPIIYYIGLTLFRLSLIFFLNISWTRQEILIGAELIRFLIIS